MWLGVRQDQVFDSMERESADLYSHSLFREVTDECFHAVSKQRWAMTQVTRCANKIRQIWSIEDISTTVTLALTEVATLFNARILQTSILTTITTPHPEW